MSLVKFLSVHHVPEAFTATGIKEPPAGCVECFPEGGDTRRDVVLAGCRGKGSECKAPQRKC